jgi:hypothetical protein
MSNEVTPQQGLAIMRNMFSVDPASAPMDWLDSDQVICVFSDACPRRVYISEQNSEELNNQAVSLRSS